jgi:hypothetical protein
MKKLFFLMSFTVFLLITRQMTAQPFLQLDPASMFKADLKIGGADWAGFYRTYDKGIMLIIPNTGNNIQGINVSQYGGTIRFFKGERIGNGINYSYDEFWLGDETDPPSETTGTGFMVMKDDGKTENVYCKDGDGGPAVGNFTAGKKIELILTNGAKTPEMVWEGAWKGGDKSLKDVFSVEKGSEPYTYIGFYTLEGYNSSDVQRYYNSSGWTTSITKTKMPDRTVMVLAIAYGEKLYFISNNRTESDVRAGILTQTEKNLLLWSEQPLEKINKLNEKAGAVWYRDY